MMSIVTVKMMISKKSKKVYKYNLKIFNYVYKYYISKHLIISNSCKYQME